MPPPISLLWLVQRTGTFTFVTPRTIILMVSFVSSMRRSRPPIATLPRSERHLLVPLSSLLHFLCFFFLSQSHTSSVASALQTLECSLSPVAHHQAHHVRVSFPFSQGLFEWHFYQDFSSNFGSAKACHDIYKQLPVTIHALE